MGCLIVSVNHETQIFFYGIKADNNNFEYDFACWKVKKGWRGERICDTPGGGGLSRWKEHGSGMFWQRVRSKTSICAFFDSQELLKKLRFSIG